MTHPPRRLSLDAVRGFALWNSFLADALVAALTSFPQSPLVAMLLRNYQHAPWNGYTYLDAGLPGYMLFMGASMTLSYERHKQKGTTKWHYFIHVLTRAVVLWFFVVLFQAVWMTRPLYEVSFTTFFAELAVCILVTGVVLLTIPPRWYVPVLCGLLAAHTLLLTLIPIPGYGAGDFSQAGNVESYFRSFVASHMATLFGSQGPSHVLADATSFYFVLPKKFGTCMIGLILGRLLLMPLPYQRQAFLLAGVGSAAMALAWIWDAWLPINKHLWTPPFTLFSGGFIFVLTACFVQLSEVWFWRKCTSIFTVFGRQPLLAWACFFYLIPFANLSRQLFGDAFQAVFGVYQPFAMAITPVILCWLFFAWLQKRRPISTGF